MALAREKAVPEAEDQGSPVEDELGVGVAEGARGPRSPLVPGDAEAAFEPGGDAGGAAPSAHEAARGSEELADGAAVEIDGGGPASFSGPRGSVRGGKPRSRLEARARHEGFPFGAVGAGVSSVELAGREVGHLVAEDFLEKSVGGAFETFEVRRDVG